MRIHHSISMQAYCVNARKMVSGVTIMRDNRPIAIYCKDHEYMAIQPSNDARRGR